METFESSCQVTTVAQAILALPPLPGDFDVGKNMPFVSIDAAQLVTSVGQLWAAMKGQRGFLETVEKEMARRKTEMEVRFHKMKSDMEAQVAQESKRRQSEDERLRHDLSQLRDEMQKSADAVRRDAKEAQEATQRSVDRTVTAIKASVMEAQHKLADVAADVTTLKDELQRVRSEKDALQQQLEKSKAESLTNFTTLCSFIGTNSGVVHQSVANGTEKDSFLKTPALQTLAQRTRNADDKAENAKTEAARAADTAQQLQTQVTRVAADVSKLDATLHTIDQTLRDAILLGDDKLSQRIDQLERALTSQLAHLSKSRGDGKDSPAPIKQQEVEGAAKKCDLDTLRAAFDQLKHDVGVRIAGKADQADVNAAVATLHEIVARHDADIASLFASRGEERATPVVSARRASTGELDGVVAALENLASRVTALETTCDQLNKVKADRAELRAALADLAKKLEAGLSELYQQLQALRQRHASPAPPPQQQDATAGRFRCISCNRDAGPLQEQIQERLSKSQFPPSPMIVSQATQQQQTRSIVNSRQPVPGMKEYGGGLTSSRKKLMNYYVWLQDKNDNPPPPAASGSRSRPTSAGKVRESGGTVSPRSTSPGHHPPSHPWAGAQSGNGIYGERQCGDHGSAEPDAVGLDGKYYVGVLGPSNSSGQNSRPRSAPLQGRAPAPSEVPSS